MVLEETKKVVRPSGEGHVFLKPDAEIPAREKWLFENPEALASVKRGLKQSAAMNFKPDRPGNTAKGLTSPPESL